MKYFLLSTALRNCRGQRNKPNTMLVHIVRFVGQQNKIKQRIIKYFKDEIENYIRFGDPSIESEFKSIWEEDYLPTTEKCEYSSENIWLNALMSIGAVYGLKSKG